MVRLNYDKEGKNIQGRKCSLFNKWCWKNWTATHKRIKLDYFLTQYKENQEGLKTYISVDQNKEPRNQATIIWAINL